jgi:transposase-like protein
MNIELKDFTTLAAALISSGVFYGWIKFLMHRKTDTGAVVVKTAEGVVIMQSSMMKELKEDNVRLREDNEALRKVIVELTERVRSLEERIADIVKPT